MVEPVLVVHFALLFIVLIDLVEGVEFVAGVVLHLLWDFSSSPEPTTTDFKVGFLTVNAMNSESPLSEVRVGSLQESLHCVVGFD